MKPKLQIAGDGKGERILIVQTSFLGDVVLTTPLIGEIRRRFPAARLVVLCTPTASGLLQNNPDLDGIITDDKKGAERGLRGLWRMVEKVRREGFTLAFSPHKSLRSALLLSLARIPRRVGFRQSAGWFLFPYRAHRDAGRHDVERNLCVLQPLGIEPEQCDRRLHLEVVPAASAAVKRLFREIGIERGKDRLIFGLNPGSVWPTKRWSAEGYATLMVQLKKKYRCEIVLFGGEEDRAIVNRVQDLAGHVGRSLAGRTPLTELAGAIECCDVFITNDSMPMHVAVAREVPVVAIFCATTTQLGFYPYSSKAIVVEKELACRPCGSHGGLRCPLGTEACIRLVPWTEVMRAVERFVDSPPHQGQGDPLSTQPEIVSL